MGKVSAFENTRSPSAVPAPLADTAALGNTLRSVQTGSNSGMHACPVTKLLLGAILSAISAPDHRLLTVFPKISQVDIRLSKADEANNAGCLHGSGGV